VHSEPHIPRRIPDSFISFTRDMDLRARGARACRVDYRTRFGLEVATIRRSVCR
jgi:hypothetical protein